MNSRDERIVESMAQAIHGVVCRKNPFMGKPKTWEQLPDRLRENFRDEARAAFDVVMESTVL